MAIVSLKKYLLVILLALALLAGLLGLSMRAIASPLLPGSYHSSTVQTHTLARHPDPVCPPPPVSCW